MYKVTVHINSDGDFLFTNTLFKQEYDEGKVLWYVDRNQITKDLIKLYESLCDTFSTSGDYIAYIKDRLMDYKSNFIMILHKLPCIRIYFDFGNQSILFQIEECNIIKEITDNHVIYNEEMIGPANDVPTDSSVDENFQKENYYKTFYQEAAKLPDIDFDNYNIGIKVKANQDIMYDYKTKKIIPEGMVGIISHRNIIPKIFANNISIYFPKLNIELYFMLEFIKGHFDVLPIRNQFN